MQVYISIDLGAGSGRLVAGVYDEGKLSLEEFHRFENNGAEIMEGCYWNTIGLFESIIDGLHKATEKYGYAILSIGADSWGCSDA